MTGDRSLGERYRHLMPVWVELGRRVGRGERPVRLTLRDLTLAEQSALADTLGLDRLPGPLARVEVQRLMAALGVVDLAELVTIAEACVGPIVDTVEARHREAAQRSQLWHDLATGLAGLDWVSAPAAERFVAAQLAAGVRADELAPRAALHDRLLAVLRALPAEPTSKAVVAAQLLGDPHALDSGTALARLVTSVVMMNRDLDPPGSAESERSAWETVGITSDQVSSTVLVLGLRAPPGHGLDGLLNGPADLNEPVVLTLGQLRRWPYTGLADGSTVLVVENPSIVEAVSRGGVHPWPLVCSNGLPSVAVRLLLEQLSAAGVRLLQHADFDPAGLHITRWLRDNTGTEPWRMAAADYLRALAAVPSSVQPARIAADAPVPPTAWDPALQTAMQAERSIIFEEQVLPDLLDLE